MRYSWNVCNELLESTHVLIAGTTGSGKSVLMNSMIYSAINGRGMFYLIDLKRVELSRYKNLTYTLGMATEPEEVAPLLERIVATMDNRYARSSGVECNEEPIYVFIDELADLTYSCPKKCLDLVIKIGRLGRAANIHLVCATQDPSKKTLSAQMMQNFTTRVALRCFSAVESRQIVGVNGAENLPKYGQAIVRDASGVRLIEVPMTPETDIIEAVEEDSIPKWKPILDQVLHYLWIVLKYTAIVSWRIAIVVFIFFKWYTKAMVKLLFGSI